MPITDSWLKSNHGKARDRAEEKADGAGLSVRASAKGKLVFQMRYRWEGKPVRLDLGSYPLISLKQARTRHLEMKAHLEQGMDPRSVKQAEKIRRSSSAHFQEVFTTFHDEYLRKKVKDHDAVLRSFEIHVFPHLGKVPSDEIDQATWIRLLDKIKVGAPSIASRVLQRSRQMYKWARLRGMVETAPLADITASNDLHIKKGTRGRALSEQEIDLFFFGLVCCKMLDSNKLFMVLCLLLACRNGELRSLDPTKDIHGDLWIVPATKSKTGKPIIRVLVPEVLALIGQAKKLSKNPRLLFSDGQGRHLADGTTLSMPRAVINAVRKRRGTDMAHWSMHDLRKTARTNFSRYTDFNVAEMMIGHTKKGSHKDYDYYSYLEEQRAAYAAWSSYLSERSLASQFFTSPVT